MFALFMRRLSFVSVDSRTERKRVPDNARTGTKVTKTGHFGKFRIWGFEKKCIWGSQCTDKSCAHIVYNIYAHDSFVSRLASARVLDVH